MKKIYLRGGMSPLENFDAMDIQYKNIIGSNVGNLLYQYSISRALMVEGTEIEVNRYQYKLSEADRINQECSCFIIPLADAFREDFMEELSKITALIKRLTIPCVVIGVGLRAPYEPNLESGFSFDEKVKEFVNAVLEKSSIIGVRGEITAQYLTNLGFREGIDHMVIGCPSMYSFGQELNIRCNPITLQSKIAINASPVTEKEVNDFIFHSAKKFREVEYIPQMRKELMLLYSGKIYEDAGEGYYPRTISDELFLNGNSKFYLNVPTWFEAFSDVDLVFGSRLHGVIAGILGGAQSCLITTDARTRELAAYHQLPDIPYIDINAESTMIDFIDKIDFQKPKFVQASNFERYIDFLNKNHLEHIYMENSHIKEVLFDRLIKENKCYAPIESILVCSKEDMALRLSKTSERDLQKVTKLSNEVKSLKEASKEASKKAAKKEKEWLEKLEKLELENAKLQKLNNGLSQNFTNRVCRNLKKIIT